MVSSGWFLLAARADPAPTTLPSSKGRDLPALRRRKEDRGWRQTQLTGQARSARRRAAAGEEAGPDKPRYRRFQHELIVKHCGRSVLEVGAGLGEFAEHLTDLDRLVVTDIDPQRWSSCDVGSRDGQRSRYANSTSSEARA